MCDATALAEAARRSRCFFAAVNAAYAALRNCEDDWKNLEAERSAWDSTLLDGLPTGEAWDKGGGLTSPRAGG